MSVKIKLENVRLSFPELFEAKEFETGDGKPRYSATFLIDPKTDAHKKIEDAINAAAKETFKEKAALKLKSIRGDSKACCYMSGDLKEYDGWEGKMALTSHRRAKDGPVGVYGNFIDPQTGKVVAFTRESQGKPGTPYGGCYVNATVEIYAMDGKNAGVRCGLTAVQFDHDGDSFGGAKRANPDDFQASEGADADPLAA